MKHIRKYIRKFILNKGISFALWSRTFKLHYSFGANLPGAYITRHQAWIICWSLSPCCALLAFRSTCWLTSCFSAAIQSLHLCSSPPHLKVVRALPWKITQLCQVMSCNWWCPNSWVLVLLWIGRCMGGVGRLLAWGKLPFPFSSGVILNFYSYL